MPDRDFSIRVSRREAADALADAPFRSRFGAKVVRAVLRRPIATLGAISAGGLTIAILVNALYLQPGPHPSPWRGKPIAAMQAPETTGAAGAPTASVRPAVIKAAATTPAVAAKPTMTRMHLVTEIQRELARRGFYEGAIDGIYGPRMDAAIREFEQAARLRVAGEPNESLLATVARSHVRAERAKVPTPPAAPRRSENQVPAPAPSRRVTELQRALTDFGYGQLKLSGVPDAATKAAIEKFERDRKLPVRGEISDRLMRELAAVTGRPLE